MSADFSAFLPTIGTTDYQTKTPSFYTAVEDQFNTEDHVTIGDLLQAGDGTGTNEKRVFLSNTGGGVDLALHATDGSHTLKDTSTGQVSLKATSGAGTGIYFAGVEELVTISGGVESVGASDRLLKLYNSTNGGVRLFYDNSNDWAQLDSINSSGDLVETYIRMDPSDGKVSFGFGGTLIANTSITGWDVTGDVTATGEAIFSGTGPHHFGIVDSDTRFAIGGAYTSSGGTSHSYGFSNVGTITANNLSDNLFGMISAADITTQDNNELITLVAQAVFLAPNVIEGTDTINLAATVYIDAAPSTRGDDYALYIASGNVNIVGGISRFSRSDLTPSGIAETTADDLVIGSTGSTNAGITIFTSSGIGDGGSINFGDSSDADVGRILFDHFFNQFSFRVAGTNVFSAGVGGFDVVGDTSLGGDLDVTGNTSIETGFLSFGAGGASQTIAAGVITAVKTLTTVNGQGATNDDLDTINSASTSGQVLLIRPNGNEDITVTQNGNIRLTTATIILTSTNSTLTLISNGSLWLELARAVI